MHLSTEEKKEIFAKYGQGANDTGSPESQIALFSVRIKHLTEHLKANHKDYATARALKALVGQRRSLLDYLIRKDINRYRAIIAKKELGILRPDRASTVCQDAFLLLLWKIIVKLAESTCERYDSR